MNRHYKLRLNQIFSCWANSTMTSQENKVTPVGSTFTMVCNAVISLEILLISEQDDTALWQMYASAMRYSPDHVTPEVEKQTLLQMLLSTSGGREGAIQYLEYVKRTLHPDAVQIGVRCLSAISYLILTTLG